jgi:predicted aspartyl protease
MASCLSRCVPALLLAAASLPALAADPECLYQNLGSLPIRYSDPGMQPSMQGAVNGKPTSMLIDTGAYGTILMRPMADAADVLLQPNGQVVSGIGGSQRMYTGRVNSLDIGPVKLKSFNMRVLDNGSKDIPYGAIVGVDFLLQMDMQISLANRKLTYFKGNDDCREAYLRDIEKSVVVDYLSAHKDVRPNIEVLVNGKKLTAIVDSGASRSVIFRRSAERAGITAATPGVVKGGKSVGIGDFAPDAWHVPIGSFSVGRNQYSNLKITMLDDVQMGSDGADMLLGADFLRTHDVLFAKSQRKMYLTYRGGPIFSTDYRTEAAWYREEADLGNHRAQQQVGRDLFVGGDFKTAAGYLGGAAKAKPDNPYVYLWHYIALARAGDRTAANSALASYRANFTERSWPAAMADFLLGQIDSSSLLALRDAAPAKQKLQTCEANYMQAQHKLLLAEREPAKALFESIVADCPPYKLERIAAAVELQRWK